MKKPAVMRQRKHLADASEKASAKQWNQPWTETELKYFAFILAEKKNEFGYKLNMPALKKTANNTVFEDIKKAFEKRMSSEEFKKENDREHCGSKSKKDLTPLRVDVERLWVKFKWMKDQWHKYMDRIKKGSDESAIQEPEWYKIINPPS